MQRWFETCATFGNEHRRKNNGELAVIMNRICISAFVLSILFARWKIGPIGPDALRRNTRECRRMSERRRTPHWPTFTSTPQRPLSARGEAIASHHQRTSDSYFRARIERASTIYVFQCYFLEIDLVTGCPSCYSNDGSPDRRERSTCSLIQGCSKALPRLILFSASTVNSCTVISNPS